MFFGDESKSYQPNHKFDAVLSGQIAFAPDESIHCIKLGMVLSYFQFIKKNVIKLQYALINLQKPKLPKNATPKVKTIASPV